MRQYQLLSIYTLFLSIITLACSRSVQNTVSIISKYNCRFYNTGTRFLWEYILFFDLQCYKSLRSQDIHTGNISPHGYQTGHEIILKENLVFVAGSMLRPTPKNVSFIYISFQAQLPFISMVNSIMHSN